MRSHFDARKDSDLNRRATRAYVETLLADLLPDLRLAARGCGYAIAVHGSLARDIDLVAVPWVEDPDDAEQLLQRLLGVLSGKLGRACALGKWSAKPHGRRAVTIVSAGGTPEIDLSVMPTVEPVT